METQVPRVLFVDDDQSVLDGIRRATYGGFSALFAQGGQEALDVHRLVAGARPGGDAAGQHRRAQAEDERAAHRVTA